MGKLKTPNLLPLVGADSFQEGNPQLQHQRERAFVSVLTDGHNFKLHVGFPVPSCRAPQQKECKLGFGKGEGGQCCVGFPNAEEELERE